MANAVSISSGQKIKFLSEAATLIQTTRPRLTTAMSECDAVARLVAMSATDRVANAMANIANGMNDLLDKTQTSFGGIAEVLCKGSERIGPEFTSKIKVIAGEYAALSKGEVFSIRQESSGLDDNMTPESKAKLEAAILEVIALRALYINTLGDISMGAKSDPDFRDVILAVGIANENFGNEVLLPSFTSVEDALADLGIYIKDRLDNLQVAASAINGVSMPQTTAAALEI